MDFCRFAKGKHENNNLGLKVAIRAFFPVWVMLYVAQFILWPLISRDYWFAASLKHPLRNIELIPFQGISFLRQ